MADILTIREAVQRAKTDGIPISEYALRIWVRTGAIPARKVGQKVLLFYPNLVRYLQCLDDTDTKPIMMAAASGIRQVDL